MARHTVDVDPAQAEVVLGTETRRATIEVASDCVNAEAARRRFVQLGAEGVFADLLDSAIERQMWA